MSRHPSVTDMAQNAVTEFHFTHSWYDVACLHVTSHEGRVCTRLPTGAAGRRVRVCRLQISDPQTDHVRAVCGWSPFILKGNLVVFVHPTDG